MIYSERFEVGISCDARTIETTVSCSRSRWLNSKRKMMHLWRHATITQFPLRSLWHSRAAALEFQQIKSREGDWEGEDEIDWPPESWRLRGATTSRPVDMSSVFYSSPKCHSRAHQVQTDTSPTGEQENQPSAGWWCAIIIVRYNRFVTNDNVRSRTREK